MTSAPNFPPPKVRLHVPDDLFEGANVTLSKEQSHKLHAVLRLQAGAAAALFNGRDGEWSGVVESLKKNTGSVAVGQQIRGQTPMPDLWLVFAPIKRARINFVAEKTSELGVAEIHPVISRRTMVSRVNTDRLRANAREAAEQCERLDLPQVAETVTLERFLDNWPIERRLMWCDEGGSGGPAVEVLRALDETEKSAPWAVLIGPEGGFDDDERRLIADLPHTHPVSLGPRLLRADTAAAAALSIWQAVLGDWAVT